MLVLMIVFAVFTPITLVASAYSLWSVRNTDNNVKSQAGLPINNNVKILASTDSKDFPEVSSNIILDDARPEILRRYFTKVESALTPHSTYLVQIADKYGLDYRLLPAIAIKESGACRIIPPGGHNCWGWGIHSAGTLGFDSYEESIETVAKGLKEKYIDLGYVTPDQIMEKYAHPDSTTWGPDVSAYMETLQ